MSEAVGRDTPSGAYAVKMRRGAAVFGVLVVLELLEFVIGVSMDSGATALLAVLAVAASWPIVSAYMHVRQLREGEES